MFPKSSVKFSLFLTMSIILVFSTLAFAQVTDVKGHWAEKQINSWIEKGFAKGYSDGTFKPNNTITRAEFVTLVNKAFNFTATKKITYSDVKANAWFADEFAKAKAAGYIQGYQDGTIKANDKITRQEAAVIIARLLKLSLTGKNDAVSKFTDVKAIPDWSKGSVNVVVEKGYMKGYPDNSFKPTNNITRAEAVAALEAASKKETTASGGSGSNTSTSITTKEALIAAVASNGSGTVTLGRDIDLGADALDINRAVTINGGGHKIIGNVSVNINEVNIKNSTITGDLYLAESIGNGDATFDSVTVQGETVIRGGGANSIHFNDSVLVTVIVNKNNGAVRIVLEGNSSVVEVQLETPVTLETIALATNSQGFKNVVIPESFSGGNVRLVGTFDSINTRAANLEIQLDQNTDINTLVLNAATQILGNGLIGMAEINTDGSTLSVRPQNVLLNENTSFFIDNEEITESYSNPSLPSAIINGMQVTQASVQVTLNHYVAGLTKEDYILTASLDGNPYELQNVTFNVYQNRFTFDPVSLEVNKGKELEIIVAPAENSTKLYGQSQTKSLIITSGFEGRITDVLGYGVSGVTIKFRPANGSTQDDVYAEATTDRFGYYSVSLPEGTYIGEICGRGFIPTYMIAVAATDEYLNDQNETAIRAAGLNEVKIMLTWGSNPEDEDSHLIGPGVGDDTEFHTWWAEKDYNVDGFVYADLDWDDTNSFGPETTTIRKLVNGKYRFYVHNFSGDGSLRNSGAKVRVFMGNSTTANYTFDIPTGEGKEQYWIVFDMIVTQNGQSITISPVNLLTDFATRSDLISIINEAQWYLETAHVGNNIGDYPQQAVDELSLAVQNAEAFLTLENYTDEELENQLDSLSNAIDVFLHLMIKPQAPAIALDEENPSAINVSGAEDGAYIRLYNKTTEGYVPVVADDKQLTVIADSYGKASFIGLAPGVYAVTQLVIGENDVESYYVESGWSNEVTVNSQIETSLLQAKDELTDEDGAISKVTELKAKGFTFTEGQNKLTVAGGVYSTELDALKQNMYGIDNVFAGFTLVNPNPDVYTQLSYSDFFETNKLVTLDADKNWSACYNLFYNSGEGWTKKQDIRTMTVTWGNADGSMSLTQTLTFDATDVTIN